MEPSSCSVSARVRLEICRHQRGLDTVTKKPILDQEKIERWADQLLKGEAYLGQLSWNFRKEEVELEYDSQSRQLTIGPGGAAIPDSAHRHIAIVKAVESADRGSTFNRQRKVSVRIYNAPATEEKRIFYAMNQEGKKADPTRSKWLHPVGATKLASALVERSEHLRDNVDTVRDRISQRNPRLCAFNTLNRAIEEYWSNINPENQDDFQSSVEYLVRFWDKLVEVRQELKKLDITHRKKIRETSLVDSALAIAAFIAIARKMREQGVGLEALEELGGTITGNGRHTDFFSRDNPRWKEIGVLVPSTRKDGRSVLNLRNARQSRDAMTTMLAEIVGVDLKAEPASQVAAAASS